MKVKIGRGKVKIVKHRFEKKKKKKKSSVEENGGARVEFFFIDSALLPAGK